MNAFKALAVASYLLFSLSLAALSPWALADQNQAGKELARQSQAFLESLVGAWEGTCRTWLQPGVVADESLVQGEFRLIPGSRVLRHTYSGEIRGKPRTGEETIVFNPVRQKFQSAWFDDFHMNYGIMFAQGVRTSTGFVVVGEYAVGPDRPPWLWRTVFELNDNDHLTVTAYNVAPTGEEARAVETKYIRKKPQ